LRRTTTSATTPVTAEREPGLVGQTVVIGGTDVIVS